MSALAICVHLVLSVVAFDYGCYFNPMVMLGSR